MKAFKVFSLFILWPLCAQAQMIGTALPFITYPRGATSFGLASQGVALSGGLSGMQYNPATLFSLQDPTAEYGKLDMFISPVLYPLSWYRAGMKMEHVGVFGLEFTYFDLGEYGRTDSDPTVIETFHGYEWALGLSYATDLNESFALGGTVRYALSRLAPFGAAEESGFGTAHALLLGAGVLYHKRDWDDRFSIGFSLTDFGAPVSYVDDQQGDPAPAIMRLGFSVAPIQTGMQKLTLSFEGSRPVVDQNEDFSAKSSFAALFSSFKRWPHDITGRAGALYEFPQLPLTRDVSLAGKIAVGVFDEPYGGGFNYLTSSFVLGVDFFGVDLSFAAASVWNHIRPNSPIMPWWGKTIPEEALTMTVAYRGMGSDRPDPGDDEETVVVGGVGLSSPVGRLRDQAFGSGPAFSVECAHFTSDQTAIVISLGYQTNDPTGIIGKYDPQGTWTTWRTSMAYRIAPKALAVPLYIQAGPVLSRIGYSGGGVVSTLPTYLYNVGIAAGAGITVEVGPIIVVPSVDFVSTLFGESSGPAPRLGGYNQWIFGIKSGMIL